MRISHSSVICFVIPIVLLEAFWFIHAGDPGLYWRLVKSEHMQPGIQYLEWLQFFSYAAAGIVALRTFRNVDRTTPLLPKMFLLVFAAGCFLIALEEVSYGQRVFQFKVPDAVARVNLQKEMNLHNLVYLQYPVHYSFIVVGLVGGLGWLARPLFRGKSLAAVLTPDWSISSYFLPVAVFYAWTMTRAPKAWTHQELFEFVLAVGVLLFAMSNHSKMRRRVDDRIAMRERRP